MFMNTTRKLKKIKLILTCFCFAIFASYILFSNLNNINSKANIDDSPTLGISRSLPSIIVLDDPNIPNSAFAGDKGKTPFDHNQHISERAKITCVTCHHTNSNTLTVKLEEDVLKCAVCHQADDTTCTIEGTNENNKFKGKLAINAKEAYHGQGEKDDAGCISCHKSRNIEPTSCTTCHTNNDNVEYGIEPLFPTISSNKQVDKTIIGITQNNYTIKTYPNNYSGNYPSNYWNYPYNSSNNNWHNPQPSSHYPRQNYSEANSYTPNYWSNSSNTNSSSNLHLSVLTDQEKKQFVTNSEGNTTNYPQPTIKPISNVYLSLENEKPDKKEIKIDNSSDNSLEEKNPPKELVSDLPANLTTNFSPSTSLIDQLLPWVNKIIIVIIIFLYLDIRRKLSS